MFRAVKESFGFISSAKVAMTVSLKPLIVVLGATGTGKSQLAVEIAKHHNGEIINGDAMQLYEGLPIITNKITTEEQEGIAHHLLGVIGVKEEAWTVRQFKKRAEATIEEIRSRGKLPILVGGTHYYTQSLLFKDGLVESQYDVDEPEMAHIVRKDLDEQFPILQKSAEEMLQQLRSVDPVMADRWHPNDKRKIQRSLEIFLRTGKKASELYKEQREKRLAVQAERPSEGGKSSSLLKSTLLFWVHADPELLKPRLDARVDKMVASGLVEEVKSLDQFLQSEARSGRHIDQTRGIWVSIGYKEFEPYIRALQTFPTENTNTIPLFIESAERTKTATRQYARQQVRWIRTKLFEALAGESASNMLYVLDGSNLTEWEHTVSKPAIAIVSRFLSGDDLPEPTEVCSAASELLSLKSTPNMSERPDLWVRRYCEHCKVTIVIQEQWEAHLKSRTHRRIIRKEENERQRLLHRKPSPREIPADD